MKKDKEWLKEQVHELFQTAFQIGKMEYYEADESVYVINELVNQLEEPEKPVIPQFVADYIESKDDPIYEMCINYEMWGVNGDDGTTRFTREVAEWFDDHLNVENYYRACIDGYEVEKEKLYRVRSGGRYVRFNLDGSIIGVKKHNSIVHLERLSKLPFDYKKAVESGIITLEEVTE